MSGIEVRPLQKLRAELVEARTKLRRIQRAERVLASVPIADNVPALIAYFDADEQRVLFANKAYARMWGWDERSIVGRRVEEVIGEAGAREIAPHIQRALAGESVLYERTVTTPDGGTRVLEVNLLPQRDAAGRPVAACVLINDISRHRQAEQSIRDSELRMRKFADASHSGIVFHEDGLITDVNDALLRLFGYREEELVGTPILDHVPPGFREQIANHVREGHERPYESEIRHKDGTHIPVEITGRMMPFGDKVHRLSVITDIRGRRESQARINYLAHHDQLTGLPNRTLLIERLDFIIGSAARRGAQVALLFIDLDNFKTVNDSLGHGAGDTLLKVIAARLQQHLRSIDVVSRHGGDEFLVVLPDLEDERGPLPVAEKLIATINEPMVLEGQTVSVSPSIGISLFPRDATTPDMLIRNADAAMYLAKEQGRNNYQFFNESLAASARESLILETRLRAAIRESAFRVHYQPQLRMDTGELVGLEALIRWPQADGTWIEPSRFIPVAEHRGLIRPIGSWVLREACRQNREWQDAGLAPVPVAVNLSAVQFRQRNLLEEVETVLAETGLDPRWLAFELTESMLMEAMGVRIAIDDFGTGHSSLMNLKRFPIDKLKIDRTFVQDTPGDADDCAIIAAIIDLARNMGITSIAEGVASREQLDFLRAKGCDEVQGYLFARAMPPGELANWMGRPRTGTINTRTASQSD